MTLHLDRPAWQQHAACHGMTALFFPASGEDARPARAICAGCPVKTECLDFAIDGGDHHGVFGGTSERERRTMRRGDRAKEPTMPARACGKSNGAAAQPGVVHALAGTRTTDKKGNRVGIAAMVTYCGIVAVPRTFADGETIQGCKACIDRGAPVVRP